MSTYQPSSGIIERIRGLLPTMPDAQRSLAELVLGDPAAVARMTIVELAEQCGVSTGTITRFCRALGMNGYAALRIALASDSGRIGGGTWAAHIGTDVTEGDDIRQVANVISANIGHVVAEAIANLDLAAVERAASLLAAARRVVVFGVVGSATTALGFQQLLYQIGVPAWVYTDAHMALTGAALMTRGDVLVAVSHSGRTREVCDLVAEARSHGARTIAITNDLASPVARRAELALATAVYEMGGSSTENILARHAQLAALDVLYIAIAQRTFEQTREAIAVATEAVRPYKIVDAAGGVDSADVRHT
ncbi:MurR/RpiR family transcriptional regulator [Nonomuraea guangzhouensis]|uniref:MurR/RpiR family transcriptional regulator n=1 Tax=Nonomuraea guangzhouensis TaxID=1291555 RepID=A0ABW4GEW9_9ACTN|nr:MurR/RpiR family transcriptional regulator [Nonomuraea guangzhouensis]